MGAYHNKLDKKYFNKSIYAKKFEETFNIKLKDHPLQYDILLDTYNTILCVNNTLFSLNYIPINQKVDNLIHIINAYINKYKNKIKKSYDLQCISFYNGLENYLDELNEMKDLHDRNKKNTYNLKPFEKEMEQIIDILDKVNFDKLVDSKDIPYNKKPNDKLPKKYNLKIVNDLDIKASTIYDAEKQEKLNNKFINDYLKTTGINLNEEQEQKDFIFDTLNRIKDLNNAIVDYIIYKDKAVLNIFNYYLTNDYLKQDISFVKDITYINVFNKLKGVSNAINEDKIDIALEQLKDLIEQFKELYERMS